MTSLAARILSHSDAVQLSRGGASVFVILSVIGSTMLSTYSVSAEPRVTSFIVGIFDGPTDYFADCIESLLFGTAWFCM